MEARIEQLDQQLSELKAKRMEAYPLIMGSDPGNRHSIGSFRAMSRTPPRVYSLQEKMEMRMGWVADRHSDAFACVEYHRLGDKVFVWVLTKDVQSVVLEDDHALFPSDTLITKIRMMGG